MRNTFIAGLNIPKKALLTACAAAALTLPLVLELLFVPISEQITQKEV